MGGAIPIFPDPCFGEFFLILAEIFGMNGRHMATLVFDIETSALPRGSLDESQQEYIFRSAENMESEDEKLRETGEIEKMFSLWPFTAQVVCIAMQNIDTGRGKSLFLADDYDEGGQKGDIEYVACPDETELLGGFWSAAKHFDKIVTFNGRAFDVPFLYLRSALLGIPITMKNWMGYRFSTDPHCDLADQLCFYGVSGRFGAARKFNLDFYCRAFGIESPKGFGISGMDVTRLVQEERFHEIAEYCVRDVQATSQLYKIWKERLEGIK
jgi:3'-5' exonuclease